MAKYFTLTTSDDLFTKRFKVVLESYSRRSSKRGKMETTVDEKVDIHRGGVYKSFLFTVKVREEEPDTEYGDLYDLEYFHSLNNPQGSPSDKFTLVDHFENSYLVAILGDFDPKLGGVMIIGQDAWYFPQINFQVIEALTS